MTASAYYAKPYQGKMADIPKFWYIWVMGKQGKFNRWIYKALRGTGGKVHTWYIPRDFKEKIQEISKATYTDGIFQFLLNVRSEAPLNPSATRIRLIKALCGMLGVKDRNCYGKPLNFICTVSYSNALRKKWGYLSTVQFYCRTKELPSSELMTELPRVVEENLAQARYLNVESGEVLSYQELPEDYGKRRTIVRLCQGTEKVLRTTGGSAWEFA